MKAGIQASLEILLVAAGLLIVTAFVTEPVLAVTRRRRAARSRQPLSLGGFDSAAAQEFTEEPPF